MTASFQNRPITRQPVHIIYRLANSLPLETLQGISSNLQIEIDQALYQFGPKYKLKQDQLLLLKLRVQEIKRKYQELYDQRLDQTREGPMYLQSPKAKEIVINSWLYLEKSELLEIDAISVMSNHVHILLSHANENGSIDFKDLLKRHKHFTATRINKLLNRTGKRFWAKHAFDRDVRRKSYGTVLWYILNNPVEVGLTKAPLSWCGNYLADRLR